MFKEIYSASNSRPNLFISSSKVICFWVLPVFHYGLTDDIRIHLILNALDGETTYHFRDSHPSELGIISISFSSSGENHMGYMGPCSTLSYRKLSQTYSENR